MASIKTISYAMPRGDSRSLPLSIPASVYTPGSSIFFILKTAADNVLNDSTGYCPKKLTDANIVSITSTTINYLLNFLPSDTNNVPPATYLAEFEYVSVDQLTVITYPDPDLAQLKFTIGPDLNRRTSGVT